MQIRRIPLETKLKVAARDYTKIRQIDAMSQFLMLDKAARVDFRKLNVLNIEWVLSGFLQNTAELSGIQKRDKELYDGINEVEISLKDDIVDPLNMPIDLVFEYNEATEVIGVLPIYQEDRVGAD